MRDKKDFYLAAAVIVAALIIAFAGPVEAGTLTVGGEGEAYAAPDTASFSFNVNGFANTVDAAKASVDARQEAIASSLLMLGVPREGIQTQSYSIHEDERWDKESSQYIKAGWRVSSTLSVKTKDINNIGPMMDAVAKNNGEMWGSIRFYIEDDEELRERAMSEAVAQAREKAESVAKESGVRLAKIRSITPGYGHYPIYRAYTDFSKEASGAAVEPGQERISASVTIVYELA